MREHTIRVDNPTPCFLPENRDIFDEVIDLSFGKHSVPNPPRRRRLAIKAAKEICLDCPEREQCLTVHGPDLALGVVAGPSDVERGRLYGEAS